MSMFKDRIRNYYLNLDYNCAESIVYAANDEFRLDIAPDDFKLLGGFGGGMGCKSTCGALIGCIAVIGKLTIAQRAHATSQLRETCAEAVARFRSHLGSDVCEQLMPKYKKDEDRCLEAVLKASEVLTGILRDRDCSCCPKA